MQRYNDYVTDQYGNPVIGATVLVLLTGTSTPASLFADNSLTPLTNPVVSDALGKFYFYAADGRYDLQISGQNFSQQTIQDVLLEDPLDGSAAVFSGITVTTLNGLLRANGSSPVGLGIPGDVNGILPDQTGYAGLVLTTNGSTSSWASPGVGTVFSVDVAGGTTGLTASGGPVTTTGTITLGGILNVANGGTGQNAFTDGQVLIGNSTGGLTKTTLTAGSGVLITNGDGSISISSTIGGGTVTSASVVTANGFAGTVANPTSTPAITLTTSVTGMLKGNGTAISAATDGVDYISAAAAQAIAAEMAIALG